MIADHASDIGGAVDGGASNPLVARRRKLDPDALREHRQRSHQQARAAEGVALAGVLAQLASQPVPHALAGAQGNDEPFKRVQIEVAEADLDACAIQEPDYLNVCEPL